MAPSFRTILFACACCAALAACDISDDRNSVSKISATQQSRPVTSLDAIEGFWFIERFEDFEPSWENGTPWRTAYLQIDDNWITYNLGCNQSGNPASLGTDGILHDTGDGSRVQTLQGCGTDQEARDARFFAFFGSKPEVRWIGPGRVSLNSDAGDLVLIAPELWRHAHKPEFNDIEGRWVPEMSSTFEGWGFEGYGIGGDPGVVTIRRGRLLWSHCPDLPIPVRWTKEARFKAIQEIDISDCTYVARTTENGPSAVMTMLTANPAVIRTGADRIVLLDGTGEKGRQLSFRSEESILNPPPPPPMQDYMTPPPPAPPPPPPPLNTTR